MKKIVIIGGGIAGLSLGIYLRKLGVDVEINESGTYPKHKVCGEFICGVSADTIQKMGLDGVIGQSVIHQKMTWWMGDALVLEDKLPTAAWGLSRYQLDEDLASLFVDMGGGLNTGVRVAREDDEGVVWATGKPKKKGRWIGLKIHAMDAQIDGPDGLEMHVGSHGYIGLCGVERNRVNCCGLFRMDQSIKGSGGALLEAYLRSNDLNMLADRLGAWQKDESSFSATAGFSFGKQKQAGAFCVGDSSYLIPPFTGNGMSMALESSWMAAHWLKRFSQGEIEWADACADYENESVAFFKKRMKMSGSIQPLLFNRWGRTLLKTATKSGMLPFEFLFHQLRTP